MLSPSLVNLPSRVLDEAPTRLSHFYICVLSRAGDKYATVRIVGTKFYGHQPQFCPQCCLLPFFILCSLHAPQIPFPLFSVFLSPGPYQVISLTILQWNEMPFWLSVSSKPTKLTFSTSVFSSLILVNGRGSLHPINMQVVFLCFRD